MNAVLYARSSVSKKQCEKQLAMMSEYAKEMGIKVVGTYSDLGASREEIPPPLRRMLQSLSMKEENAPEVVCLSLPDRFRRRSVAQKLLKVSRGKRMAFLRDAL